MSQWANEHPDQAAEIAALPPSQQLGALRAAIGYDPDAIRDQLLERSGPPGVCESAIPEPPAGEGTPSGSTSAGIPSRRRTGMDCDNCGAPEDMPCQHWCLSERYS